MLDHRQRKPYWRETKFLVIVSLVLPGLLLIAAPFLVERLGGMRVFGLPLPYFALAHGVVLVLVGAGMRFVLKQDEIDHWHGAHEDL